MKKDLAIIVTEQDLARDVCDFFRSFETQLHEAFQWIAATRNSYRNYIDQLTPYTKGIALWEANSDIFSRAIAELNSRRRKKYAEGTLNTIRSVINDVCYFAEVYSQGRYRNSLWGTTWSASFDKKETPEKKIAHRLKIPKSLNMLEEIKLLNAAKEEYFHNSNAIGLAIMFYIEVAASMHCRIFFLPRWNAIGVIFSGAKKPCDTVHVPVPCVLPGYLRAYLCISPLSTNEGLHHECCRRR